MKNYIIALLLVVILVLASIIYKESAAGYRKFPVERIEAADVDAPFFLYVFFSKLNCRPCLGIIKSLNEMPTQFKVIGVVPEEDLLDENETRTITGAAFKLISLKNYRKFIPPYSPSILGVSQKGRIFFILPGVPKEEAYLKEFLTTFYEKAYPLLITE